jgi:hypothetical protein
MTLCYEGERYVLHCTYPEYQENAHRIKGTLRWDKAAKVWWTDDPGRAAMLLEFADDDARVRLEPFAKEQQATHHKTVAKGGRRRKKPAPDLFEDRPWEYTAWDDSVLVEPYLEAGVAVDLTAAERLCDGYVIADYRPEVDYCAEGRFIEFVERLDTGQHIGYLDLRRYFENAGEASEREVVYVRI